jgi:uncharacterized RDD family membrane protein YckC
MSETFGGARPDTNSQPPGATWSEADEAYLSAARLSAWLRSGQELLPIQSLIALRPDEKVFYEADFSGFAFSQAAVRYSTGWFAAFGSPAWLAASLAGSAAYNSYQRSRAQAEGAAQWRFADQGSVHITSQRICLQGKLRWTDIALADIRALDALPDGVVIHRQGQSPIKVVTAAVAYFYVLISYLVHGSAIDVPIPEDLAARARYAGRAVPELPQSPSPQSSTGLHPPRPATYPTPHQALGVDPLGAWNSPAGTNTKVDVLGRPYADWGTRAVAWLVDGLVVLVGWAVFIALIWLGTSLRTPPDQYGVSSINGAGIAIIVIAVLGVLAFTVAYHLLIGRESGQTPGKRAVGIQVRDAATGGPISYPRALGRYLAQILAWVILPILSFVDLLWPLWDDRLQTLHDKAVNSVVVKVDRTVS